MEPRTPQTELTSLVISPNRDLAQMFASTLPATRAFHILAEMKTYPPVQTLDIRLRHAGPHLAWLALATDLARAPHSLKSLRASRRQASMWGSPTPTDPARF